MQLSLDSTMNSIAVIFGGSGYIGTNLLSIFIEKNLFSKYYVFDLKPLVGFDLEINNGTIQYLQIDVRNPVEIDLDNKDSSNSWIFNFAAIHREPGQIYQERIM